MSRSLLAAIGTFLVLACSPGEDVLDLPPPVHTGRLSLEEVLAARRSARSFAPEAPTPAQLGQLLWAAQGVTDERGHRTAPSAGALYPLEIYVVAASGVARYLPREHRLVPLGARDVRTSLHGAALSQDAVRTAPLVFVIAADYGRTRPKYGARAPRYVHIEAGHAAQNLLLQATALGLVAVPIGAFDDAAVKRVVGCAPSHEPLYLIPVGRPSGA